MSINDLLYIASLLGKCYNLMIREMPLPKLRSKRDYMPKSIVQNLFNSKC